MNDSDTMLAYVGMSAGRVVPVWNSSIKYTHTPNRVVEVEAPLGAGVGVFVGGAVGVAVPRPVTSRSNRRRR